MSTKKRTGVPIDRIAQWEIMGYDFTVQRTKSTYKIERENETYFYTRNNNSKLTLICYLMIKRDIEKLDLDFTQFQYSKIHYVNFNNQNCFAETTHYEGIKGFDINSAYLSVLKNKGFISDKTFKKVNSMPKKVRIKCFGMLATVKYQTDYSKGSKVDTYKVSNQNLRGVFFYAARIVDNCLFDIFSKFQKYIAFYWVDGIYFLNSTPENVIFEIRSIFDSYGFEIKDEIIDSFKIIKERKSNIIEIIKKGKKKQFNIKKQKYEK